MAYILNGTLLSYKNQNLPFSSNWKEYDKQNIAKGEQFPKWLYIIQFYVIYRETTYSI